MDKLSLAKERPSYFCERLSGVTLYKVRVGDYRIIVEITSGVIDVLKVDHRSRIYERLRRERLNL